MSVLVIGNHYWGHGPKLADAKRNFTAQGGRLSGGYTVVQFPPTLVFKGVDEVGRVRWDDSAAPGDQPTVRQVSTRKTRAL